MKIPFYAAVCVICLAAAVSADSAKAETFDCNQDPVFSREFTAKTSVGSRVRSVPCMEGSEILTVIPANKSASVIAETDGWYKVNYGGVTGWVGSRLLTKTGEKVGLAKKENDLPNKKVELVGITERDYEKLKAGNSVLRKRLMNKIVLRVHAHGEAYLLQNDGTLRALRTAKEVKDLRDGVKSSEAKKVVAVKEVEEKKDQVKMDSDTIPAVSGTIALTGQMTDPGKVKLAWTIDGVDAPQGFKVVISENSNPVYPGNDYHYYSDSGKRDDLWTGLSGKTYHFRVCQYLGGKCGVYSNDVAVQVTTNGAVAGNALSGNIALTVTAIGDGKAALVWTLKDMTSPKGFKTVVSEQANPVYPGNDYHYLTDPNQATDTWTSLTAGKSYHFRVCEYLGGYCGTYSNDVIVTVN